MFAIPCNDSKIELISPTGPPPMMITGWMFSFRSGFILQDGEFFPIGSC